MDFNNDIPIYLQIVKKIKSDILSGIYSTGDKLPSVRELAVELKVNPNTIQRVYQELDREKITFTKRGLGTFITDDKDILNSISKEFTEDIFKRFINEAKKAGYSNQEILDIVKKYLKGEV